MIDQGGKLMKRKYFTEDDLQKFEEDYDVSIQPDQDTNKQAKDSKLLTCFIYFQTRNATRIVLNPF